MYFKKKNIPKKLHKPFYIIVYIFILYNPFSKKVYGENLMLNTLCGMVTQTVADSERFITNFSFYKQRRVNFVVFLTVCVCLSLLSKEKRKCNSKRPNAYGQFLFVLKYIIIQFTKKQSPV